MFVSQRQLIQKLALRRLVTLSALDWICGGVWAATPDEAFALRRYSNPAPSYGSLPAKALRATVLNVNLPGFADWNVTE